MGTPFVNIHTHHPPGEALTLHSWGIHPWWLDDPGYDYGEALEQLEKMLAEGQLEAVGETGLDKLHADTLPLQRKILERHIQLAEQYRKPLILHSVRANDELLRLLKQQQPQQPWIFHGFNGSREEALQFAGKGCYLSVGTGILNKHRKITETIRSIPLNHLFFETDDAACDVETVYAQAASILALPIEVLQQQVYDNYVRLKQPR